MWVTLCANPLDCFSAGNVNQMLVLYVSHTTFNIAGKSTNKMYRHFYTQSTTDQLLLGM